MTIILRKFNKNNININSVILIIGEVNSGKSTLTKDILYMYKDIPCGIVICNKNNTNSINLSDHSLNKKNDLYNYIPPIFIHNCYDKHIVKDFIKRQYILSENYENNDNLYNNNYSDNNNNYNNYSDNNNNNNYNNYYYNKSFIILDDCLYNRKYYKDKYLNILIESSKLYNYLCIIETQYLTKINDNLINNIDYLFILKDSLDVNRRRIYDQFKKILGIEYTVFTKILDDYTNNYNLLVLDLKYKSTCIEDKLYWYKAHIHNNFRICNEESWNYNNNNYIIEPPKRNINRSIFY
jgi:hypothetical protein